MNYVITQFLAVFVISFPSLIVMPYVDSSGTVVENRSSWRLSIVSDFFWTIANGVGLFFSTLFNPTAALPPARSRSSQSSQGQNKGGGGGGANVKKGPNIRTLPKACNTGS